MTTFRHMSLEKLPLQSLIWPDPHICVDDALYFSLAGDAKIVPDRHEVRFAEGGAVGSGTAMNIFNLGKWRRYCGLTDLSLELEGQGRFTATIWHATGAERRSLLSCEEIELHSGAPHILDFDLPEPATDAGVILFGLQAKGDGVLRRADWCTRQSAKRCPSLLLSITTFRREEDVLETIARFQAFVEASPLAGSLHLTVVDNGRSLPFRDAHKVSVLPSPNYGGSGGFARGLLDALDRGASHCLFMDDDARVHFGAVERTVMFLAHASDERVAVSGALTTAERPWEIWENGARFDVFCRPEFKGTDLRQHDEVVEMERDCVAEKPVNYYCGWWYFAFPVSHVRHMPFPFFVRGDDVGFSLMNRFRAVPLTGAICFQNEDFSAKESPRMIYLDLRSHVAHHLYAPQLNGSLQGGLKVPLFFFVRFLISCHYETLAAVNLALRDALSGPKLFRRTLDMSKKLNEITSVVVRETWRRRPDADLIERRWINPDRILDRLVMKCTLNGHLLPFFSKLGNHVVLPSAERGHRRVIWGAARITYVSADGSQNYTVVHDKRRAMREAFHFLTLMARFIWRCRALRRDWREHYPSLTSRAFWRNSM